MREGAWRGDKELLIRPGYPVTFEEFDLLTLFYYHELALDMDEVFDIIDFDLGELIEGGLQLVLAFLLLVTGVIFMVASLIFDGLLIWGVVLFIGGIIVGIFAIVSFFDIFF
jgi:hypothetical protein